MPNHPLCRIVIRWTTAAVVTTTLFLAAAPPAAAQSAAALYERALARERSARTARDIPVTTLRSIAVNYENVVRRYPRSGYSDNALWQAAGLLQLVWDRTQREQDRARAVRYLTWLKREYPSSSLIAQIPTRLAALTPEPEPTPATAASRRTPEPAPPAAGTSEAPGTGTAPEAPQAAAPPPAASTDAIAETAATDVDAAAGDDVGVRPIPRAFPLAAVVTPAERPREVPADPEPAEPPVSLPVSMAEATVPADDRPPTPIAASAAPAVRSIRHSPLPKGDRITIELSREATFTSVRTSGPDRLVLSFDEVVADPAALQAASGLSGTFIDDVTVSGRSGAGLELRLALAGHPRFSTFPLYDPYRVIIDVEGDRTALPPAPPIIFYRPDPRDPASAVPPEAPPPPASAPLETVMVDRPEAPASTSRGDYSLARQLGLGVSRIVIDPGHGGHDPGAQANGVSEAELVLDIAKRLGDLLDAQPGFEVVLTRSTDTYVSLEDRTAIANREQADLFLSIHANASRNADTRGIETYFLSFATSEEAEAVAARENASSAQAMHILPEIVKTIATNDKVAESREFASMVQTSLMRRIGSLNKTIKDLGVKQAPFVVLIGAQMPSVLAEISFLTNRTEANLLQQAAHRERIAQALCDAILGYQGSLKKVTTVAARGN